MRHGVSFDMTLIGFQKTDMNIGQQISTIDSISILFYFDNEKLFWCLRRLTNGEMCWNDALELTSFEPWLPEDDDFGVKPAQIEVGKVFSKIPMTEWWKRLGFIPDKMIPKTMDVTTQYCLVPEEDNREGPCRHYKSRYPFLHEQRLNHEVHSDTFFPSVV